MPISGSSPRRWQRTEAETRRGNGAGGQGPSWVAGGEAGQRWRNREAATTSVEEGRRQWREVLVGGGEAVVKEVTAAASMREEGAKAEGEKREGTEERRWGFLGDELRSHGGSCGRRDHPQKDVGEAKEEQQRREREKAVAVSTTTEEGADGRGKGEKAATVGDAEAERERSNVERTQRSEGERGRKGGGGGPTTRTGRKRERGRWVDDAGAQRGGDKKEGRGGGRRSTMTTREKGEHG